MSADPKENPEENIEEFVASVPRVICWRCELEAPADQPTCPHCEAQLHVREPATRLRAKSADPFKVLIWSYGLLLVSSLVNAFILSETVDEFDDEVRNQALIQMLSIEAVDTLIIGVAIAMCFGYVRPRSEGVSQPGLVWLASIPLLAGLLLVNYLYHWLLREILQMPLIEDELTAKIDWLVFLTYCIQPAIVEEAYCRGFAMGVLRSVLGRHGTVWISAIMFALLHIFSPLSMPYLAVLGACLGYVRLASGTIVLPILLHFVHNLVVTFWS